MCVLNFNYFSFLNNLKLLSMNLVIFVGKNNYTKIDKLINKPLTRDRYHNFHKAQKTLRLFV
jgi:hypothetical protein